MYHNTLVANIDFFRLSHIPNLEAEAAYLRFELLEASASNKQQLLEAIAKLEADIKKAKRSLKEALLALNTYKGEVA